MTVHGRKLWNFGYEVLKCSKSNTKNCNLLKGKSRICRIGLGPLYFHLLVVCVIVLSVPNLFVDGCQISEYYCDNRKCVSLDKFCNGFDDCGDGSDEPRHCSPCNRTLYGELGGTYTIAVHRPSSRESQLPFVCQLTFAAGGSKFGDLVQLIFNSVTLGPSSDQQHSSDKNPSCREGFVTLNEPDRPATAGHWCGHDWGQAVFFSETSRVTLTLSLFSVPANPGTFAYDFRLTYKFLRKIDSSVRYGPTTRPYYRGQLLPGTFCSLIFNSCDKLRCALQSPNWPGLYPRNVTCYYAIRQLSAPVGHRAVIKLAQEKDHMIFVRNRAVSKKNAYVPGGYVESGGISGGMSGSDASMGSRSRVDELTLGDECDTLSDHVTIYDGYTIRDPVLLKFCGGGKFPTITSSGNELLMEFYSAPTDYILQNSLYTAIQGFHVDVEIKHLAIGSHTYVENHNCLFTISSFQQKRGFLTSPQHSLPSGTTCTYLLEGSTGEIVWISLLKFYIGKEYGRSGDETSGYNVAGLTASSGSGFGSGSLDAASGGGPAPSNYMVGQMPGSGTSLECNTTYLQIWQGTYSDKSNNATLLAHLCEDTPIQKTCEFMLSSSSKSPSRACHPEESFISKGPHMSLRLKAETTTVLRQAEFKLYYEFVDTRQDGESFPHNIFTQTNPQPNLHKSRNNAANNVNMATSSEQSQSGGNPATNSITDSVEAQPKFDIGSCSRIFRSQNRAIQAGSFTSPRNVFYFGRGGIRNLTCIYRFQGGRHERVKITINKVSLAGGFCKADIDPNSGRSMCRSLGRNESSITSGQVQLWEVLWNDSRILKECLCEAPNGHVSFVSVSATMDIVLQIKNMQAFHDQSDFAFEGRYEFLKHPDCSRQQKLKGHSGLFTLRQPEKVPFQSCTHYPWEIEPQSPSHYIFLTVPGRTMKKFSWKSQSSQFSQSSTSTSKSSTSNKKDEVLLQTHCDTRNRILVYSGGMSGTLLQIICPEEDASNHVEIFSQGWGKNNFPNFIENPHLSMTNLPSTNQLIVELVSRGPGSNAKYDIKYMQISRRDEPLDWNYNVGATGSSSGVVSGTSLITTSGGSVIGIDGGHKIITPGDSSVLSGGSGSATSSSSIASSPSSSLLNTVEEDVCFKFKCPELNACISPSLFCDGTEHCPSGYDEAECEFFPVPKHYLVLAAASLITFLVLSCCFGCLVCKKRRAERQEKLLMSSRTPTEEMFFGTGSSSHREIVC